MKKIVLPFLLALFVASTSTAQTKRPSREEVMNGSKATETLLDKPFIFTRGELQVGGNDVSRKAYTEAIAKSDLVIKEYGEEITKFLAGNPSPVLFKNKLNATLAKASGLESDLELTAKEYKQGNSLGGVYYLQKLYLYKGYLEGVTRIYTENQKLKDYLKSANDAIASYESREKFMDKMESNQKEMVKNLKPIPAQQSNPKIEAMVKKKFEEWEKGCTVTKVNITYSSWIVDKNELDIPVCRKLSVSIALKKSNGECAVASANVREDYMGGGTYGEAYMYLPSDPIEVPCQNIK